jgi:hypothetical protein
MKTYMRFAAVVLMMTGTLFLFNGCYEREDPRAIIRVYTLDVNGQEWPVSNAEVRLDPPAGTSQPQLVEYSKKPKLTDINGEVEYSFKYEGIIKVVAQKGTGANSCGQGVIILSYDEVYRENIRMSACY